ncbi:MAG: PD-(D/E)XK nuclease family protein [Clostridium sp.]|nr:PD-(D/E)XK nuclease family protein [Clostridium sp.]MCM1547218.1 PD-(D/E)XK nuclease family protein [Ruminococcus sp.]
MLKFILGGAGSGKSTLLSDTINAAADTGKSVIVIVPEQFSFDSDKKLYSKLGCKNFNRILSTTFTKLAAEIFEKYGSRSGEYADDSAKLILMQKTIKTLMDNKQLHYFVKQASRPDFVTDALDIVSELRQSGISADDFTAKMTAEDTTLSDKISDISLIYYAYDKMLADSGLKDSLTDISEAAAISEMNGFFKEKNVFFDEFESFTGDEYQIIEAAISQAENVFISLRIDDKDNNRSGIFDSVKNTWKKFYHIAKKYGVSIETQTLEKPLKYKYHDLEHLNMNIFRNNIKHRKKAENISVIQCAELYEEADFICSEIKRLVREQGYRYSDFSVMSRQLSEYTYIFEAAFEKYDIPYSMDVKKGVMHTSIMQYVSGIIGAISEKNFSSEMIFRYAKTHLCGISLPRVADLENYCFEWDIDGKKWSEPFVSGIDEHPFAEQTRKEIIEPLSKLRQKCVNADCKSICRSVFDFITKQEAQKRIGGIINEFKEQDMVHYAKEFKRIWGIFTDILDTISEIGGEMSISEFAGLFDMMTRHIAYSVPPQTLDGVKISPAETARPNNPKVIFIAGANDGYFPAGIVKTGLLNEKDKLLFEKSGISISRTNEELIADEKLIVYKALTHASERLYITYPLADNSGSHRYPSGILKRISDMFENDITSTAESRGLIYYSSTPKAAYINLIRYFSEGSRETESIRKALENTGDYGARIKYLESASFEKTLFVNDSALMKELYSQRLNLSATAIDEYNTCHFKYFCRTGLRLKSRRKRVIDRIGEGNLTHRCLEVILSSCGTKEEFDNITHEQIKNLTKKCTEEFLNETFGKDAADMPDINASLEAISSNIETLIEHLKTELGQSEFRPAAFELDITNGRNEPVLKTENGIEIYLTGIVDRVDIYENDGKKYLRVIDYKTGHRTFSMASLLYGLNMQMLLYLFSVTGKNGRFSGSQPAGVLYLPSGGAPCNLKRNSKDIVKSHLNDHYKMNGILLDDTAVLNAMENEIKGVFIPAEAVASEDGTQTLLTAKGSSCISSDSFEKLRKYTDETLLKMCDELYRGKIEAVPFVTDDKPPCRYCDYWSVCGNMPIKEYDSPEDDAEDIMMNIIGGENDEKLD